MNGYLQMCVCNYVWVLGHVRKRVYMSNGVQVRVCVGMYRSMCV